MRILTVRQPWALHIIQSGKDIENRSTNIAGNYRGPVAIHAAKVADEEALRALPGLPPNGIPRKFHYGAIIGVVDLIGVHRQDHARISDGATTTIDPRGLPCCHPWGMRTDYHIELANPRTLAEPIPYQGALGLRTLPNDIAQQIQERTSHDHTI